VQTREVAAGWRSEGVRSSACKYESLPAQTAVEWIGVRVHLDASPTWAVSRPSRLLIWQSHVSWLASVEIQFQRREIPLAARSKRSFWRGSKLSDMLCGGGREWLMLVDVIFRMVGLTLLQRDSGKKCPTACLGTCRARDENPGKSDARRKHLEMSELHGTIPVV
jgi:hypothetical protein